MMTTGKHTVCDIYCNSCQRIVGWKYVRLLLYYVYIPSFHKIWLFGMQMFMKVLSGFKHRTPWDEYCSSHTSSTYLHFLYSSVVVIHWLTRLFYLPAWVGIGFWEGPEVQGGQVYSWAVCLLAMNSLFILPHIWIGLHLHSDQLSKLGARKACLLFIEHNWLFFPTMFKFLPECFCLSSSTCTSTRGVHYMSFVHTTYGEWVFLARI